jgi:hypothetical protein
MFFFAIHTLNLHKKCILCKFIDHYFALNAKIAPECLHGSDGGKGCSFCSEDTFAKFNGLKSLASGKLNFIVS